jgi:LDH2 family malate/lactate/ureidoglycolate dehydrogenase
VSRTVLDAELLVGAAAVVLEATGVSADSARTVAGALVDGDLRGIPSHGLMLLPMYVDRLRAGSVSTADRAEVVTDVGAVAVLDAGHALGQLTGDQAMALAVAKAREHGVGVVTVRHAFHFGGAFRYAEQATAAGCLGIAAANTRPLMPAPGGATRVVGNNPVAIGVPRRGASPLLLDMALSEAALGKIRLAQAEGRTIPPTWATDASGVPTTDPGAAIAGMLLPMAGPKGYGLALMVDVLTGVLSGGAFGNRVQGMYADVAVPNDCAHFFLALDVTAFGDVAVFDEAIAALVAQVTEGPTAPGVERLWLPGQREAEAAAAARAHGVGIDESVLDGLRKTAALVGVTLPDGI